MSELEPKSRFDYKVSEIMEWAANNVKQVRIIYGNTENRCGCAIGATNLFLSDFKSHRMKKLKKTDPELYKKLKDYKKKHFYSIWLAQVLNDYCLLSFERIAKILRKFGK